MKNIQIPRHIAIIMDGNGRWAKQRSLPRIAGHRVGIEAVRKIIIACGQRGVSYLTLFAFSSENWQRPAQEVSHLMELFLTALKREIKKLHKNNVRIRIIGDKSRFNPALQLWMEKAEQETRSNIGLQLNIAVNYGGQWDIVAAMKKIALAVQEGKLSPQAICTDLINSNLTTSDLPHPDLFIRTSGEQRISNFLLWQLAYTELYFTKVLWPDFDEGELDAAIHFFASRERRFGCTSEQLNEPLLVVENQ